MPTFDITAPDGTHYEVTGPDGSTEQQALQQVMAQHGTSQPDSAGGSFIRGAAHGASLGFADPAVAGLQAILGDPTNPTSHAPSLGARYHENLAALRGVAQADQGNHPVASFTGDMAGGFMLPVGRINSVGAAARVGGKLGLGYGLGQGVTNDQGVGDTVDQGIKGGLEGTIGGGLLARAGQAISKNVTPRVVATIKALKDAAGGAYKKLEDSGRVISADALNAMGDSLVDKFGDKLIPETASLYPSATAAYNTLKRYSTEGSLGDSGASLSKLDQIRRVVGDATQAMAPADKFVARQIMDHLDSFIDRLGPQHLDTTDLDAARAAVNSATGQKGVLARQIKDIETNKSGALAARGAAGAGTRDRYMQLRQSLADSEDARTGALNQFSQEQDQLAGAQDDVKLLRNAQDYWKRATKAEALQKIINKAKDNSSMFGQSGYENSLRSGFRKLLNNERGISRYTPEEQDAIRQVATGGSPISATNLLRHVGKMSPQGAVPLLAEVGMYGLGGPQMLAVPAAGLAGRMGATALQSRAATKAVDLAATGPAGSAALNLPPVPLSAVQVRAMKAAGMLPNLTPGAIAALLPQLQQ
jgi:hypothetical protein